MKPKVLWIEDSARLELRNLTGPIYYIGKYDFHVVDDVTTAVNFLRVKAFDVIIVDIRLPPGSDPVWYGLYKQARKDKVQAQLGLKLLKWLLGNGDGLPIKPPAGIQASQIGVFTVETYEDIKEELDRINVTVFQQKTAGLKDTVVVDLIERILSDHNRRTHE
jgi:CheY-like chemotaxis protein